MKREPTIASSIISQVCAEHRNSDLRADDKDIIAALDAKFDELERSLGEADAKARLAEERLAGVSRVLAGEEERYLQKDLEVIQMRSLLSQSVLVLDQVRSACEAQANLLRRDLPRGYGPPPQETGSNNAATRDEAHRRIAGLEEHKDAPASIGAEQTEPIDTELLIGILDAYGSFVRTSKAFYCDVFSQRVLRAYEIKYGKIAAETSGEAVE
jgi:hypothetical protein